MKRITIILLSLLIFGCDDGGPDWPAQSKLMPSEVKGTSAKIEWPTPTDKDGIAGFRVKKNDEVVAELDADARSFTADNLSGKTEYTFAIEAKDTKGAWSQPLVEKVTTLDAQAPTWNVDAKLEVSVESKGALGAQVTFSWSSADDDSGVTHYKLIREDEEIARFEATEEKFVYQSVDVEGLYTLEAGDAADNWSEDGPTVRVWANKGMKNLLNKRGFMGNPGVGSPKLKLDLNP